MSLLPAGTARAPTIHDVAALAGVSSQTVGRFVRGFDGMRPQTRERVRAAIAELGWQPNPVARALRTHTGNRILAFTNEIAESGPSHIILSATTRAREAGYVLEVIPLDPVNVESSRAALRSVDQGYAAGVLAFAPTPEIAALYDDFAFSVPVVRETNGDGIEGPHAQGIHESGTVDIVHHLHALGHRDIYLANGPDGWYSTAKRRRAAHETAARLGMHVVGEAAGDWSASSGYAIASRIELGSASAIVAANDEMAIGAMAALAEKGVTIPGDMSVVGFDDIQLAAYSQPALTTVRTDFRASGRLAVNRLLKLISMRPEIRDLPLEPVPRKLIERASTAAPPAGAANAHRAG